MSKVYRDGRWAFDQMTGQVIHIRAGEYESGFPRAHTAPDFDVVIEACHVPSLMAFLQENTWFKVKAESREEDLKIVHRLLDLVGANVKP